MGMNFLEDEVRVITVISKGSKNGCLFTKSYALKAIYEQTRPWKAADDSLTCKRNDS